VEAAASVLALAKVLYYQYYSQLVMFEMVISRRGKDSGSSNAKTFGSGN
jgi:hypothetical protein